MADRTAPRQMPTGAIIAVLCLAGTTVSLQQTMVVPLLPGFSVAAATSRPTACPGWSPRPW